MSYSSFSVGTSRNPSIVVARVPVRRSSGRTVEQMRADENAARRLARGASFATARSLVAAPMGIPLYAGKRGMISRGEVKFFDQRVAEPATATFGLPVVTAPPVATEPAVAFGGITCVNEVRQGAAAYNRVGNKILIKSVDFRCVLNLQGTGPTYSFCRVVLVHDKQPFGAFPNFSDIFSDNVSTAPDFSSGLNMASKDRFVVLRNHVLSFDSYNKTAVLHDYVKCKVETVFRSDSGNIGDLSSGALYLIAFTNLSTAETYVHMKEIQFRIRYFD